jgi:hypothetical protein
MRDKNTIKIQNPGIEIIQFLPGNGSCNLFPFPFTLYPLTWIPVFLGMTFCIIIYVLSSVPKCLSLSLCVFFCFSVTFN